LKQILDVSGAVSAVKKFLIYNPQPAPDTGKQGENGNIYRCLNGIRVEVSTIHAAKGETHDATLVLETKYRKLYDMNDVYEMLEFLCVESKPRPVYDANHPTTNKSIRAGFMKRLYVASSRPRHLLCLAMHKDRMPPVIRVKLTQQRFWEIIEV
jgi:ATP-dependent DNA helicase UvrD/PcrA